MIKRLVSYLTKWQVQFVFLLIQLIFSLFGVYNYFFNFNLSKEALTQQSLDNEVVLAKSGAKSIEVFIKNIANQLYILESNDLVDTSDVEKTRAVFRQFILVSDSAIKDIARYDKNGKLSIIENRERMLTGENEDFSDKDFIRWSKTYGNENKIFISHPYIAQAGSAKGRVIVVVATPSYLNHIYYGTIAIRFTLEDFKKEFIDPLGSPGEESIITDLDGSVHAGKSSLLNKNIIDYAKKEGWKGAPNFIAKFREALNNDEGKTSWFIKYPSEERKEVLVAYKKIDVPNTDQDLMLFVIRNKPNTLASLTPFFAYGILWLSGGIVLTFFIGIVLTIIKKIT